VRKSLSCSARGHLDRAGSDRRQGHVDARVRRTLDDFEKVYFVAAEIQGLGLEGDGDVGVWATNSKRAEGLILAVDGVAQEFSDWGDSDKTDAAIDQSADGVEEARACAQG
jgi:hypothetical protein